MRQRNCEASIDLVIHRARRISERSARLKPHQGEEESETETLGASIGHLINALYNEVCMEVMPRHWVFADWFEP